MTPAFEIVPIDGVAPNIAEAFLRQQMALRFQKAVPDLTAEQARDAVTAVWETEWWDHPAPRTLETALEAVDSELEHWEE